MSDSASEDATLIERVDVLSENTAKLAKAYEEENIKRDKRIAYSQKAIKWSIVGSGLAVLAATIAIIVAVIATNALTSYKGDNQRARVNSCRQSVLQQKDQARIEKGNERARRVQSPEARAITAQILKQLGISQAQTDRFTKEQLAQFDIQVDRAHRLRDCSTQGIAEYLSGHGGYLPTTTTTP